MVRQLVLGSMLAALLAMPVGMLPQGTLADSLLADSHEADDREPDEEPRSSPDARQQRRTCEVQTAPVAAGVCATRMAIFQVCTGEQPEFKKCI